MKHDTYETMKIRIGNNIRILRNRKKLTQENLAKSIGRTQPNIVSYEKGEKINLEILFDIANIFEIPLEKLMFEDLSNKNTEDFPISKFCGRTYFCYYIDGNKMKMFSLKIKQIISEYKAKIIVKFDNDILIDGTIELDEKFAVVFAKNKEKNKHYIMVLNYYHDSISKIYYGGLSILFSPNSKYIRPNVKICAISIDELSLERQEYLKSNFLYINQFLSKSSYELSIGISKDNDFYKWIKNICDN